MRGLDTRGLEGRAGRVRPERPSRCTLPMTALRSDGTTSEALGVLDQTEPGPARELTRLEDAGRYYKDWDSYSETIDARKDFRTVCAATS